MPQRMYDAIQGPDYYGVIMGSQRSEISVWTSLSLDAMQFRILPLVPSRLLVSSRVGNVLVIQATESRLIFTQ